MTRFRPLILALLVLLPLIGVQAQALPLQFTIALNSLSTRLGHPITLNALDSYQYQENVYTNTAMGCPYVTGTNTAQPFQGFIFTLVYQGVSYDYRVSLDGSITFPCDASAQQSAAQPTAQPQAQAQASNCPTGYTGYLAPRLQVGGEARIGMDGTANRLRSQPSVNAQQIGLIQPGTTVSILAGPTCEDASHIVWWQVNDGGVVGWTAEGQLPGDYFLAPLGSSLPAERDLISASNVSALSPLASIPLAGVSSISFTQDGTRIALGGLSGAMVYDLATMTVNTALSDISQPVTAVAFSSDGAYLAYARQDGTLEIDVTATGTHVSLARSTSERIDSLAFSPNQGDLLAFGTGDPTGTPGVPSSWQVFDLHNNQQIATQPTGSWVRGVAFSPSGIEFAWLDTALHVIQVASGASVLTTSISQPPRGGLAWRPTPTGGAPVRSVAFVDGTTIRMDNLDAKVEQTYVGDPGFFPAVLAFSSDGSLLAAMDVPNNTATGSTLNIFSTDTSDLITSTPLEASNSLAFSPDGTLLAVAANDQVLLLGSGANQAIAVG